MKKLILFCLVVLVLSFISGLCEEGQININTANITELDEIKYIGEDRANQIIDLRPFNSVDELIEVSGIGETYLEAIKLEGLACVDSEDEEIPEVVEEPEEEVINEITEDVIEESKEEIQEIKESTPEVIKLSPKDIKSEDDKKVLDKTDYAKYGFVVFCILIGSLLILKNKRKNKNDI